MLSPRPLITVEDFMKFYEDYKIGLAVNDGQFISFEPDFEPELEE